MKKEDHQPQQQQQQHTKKSEEERKSREAKENREVLHDEEDFNVGITETAPDANGVKTVTEYRINDAGQKVKTVRQVRVSTRTTSVKRSVLARRRIPKFGRCAGLPRGPEGGVTCHGDRVYLEVPAEEKKPQEAKKDAAGANYTVSCRSCGAIGDHWTMQCPYKDRLLDFGDLLAGGDGKPSAGDEEDATREEPLASGKPGKYKPPGARGEGSGSSMPGADRSQEISTTIRVTNLSEDTTESDVKDLFSRFGPVQRVYLARNKMQQSRGFAFVSFYNRREAEKAMETLQG